MLLRQSTPQPSPAWHRSHLFFCKLSFLFLSNVCRLVPFHITPSVVSSMFTHLVGRALGTRLEGPQPQQPTKGDSSKRQKGMIYSLWPYWAEAQRIRRLPRVALRDPDGGGRVQIDSWRCSAGSCPLPSVPCQVWLVVKFSPLLMDLKGFSHFLFYGDSREIIISWGPFFP